MVAVGLVVLVVGMFWMAWGALPRNEEDLDANAAIRRGAILLPAGLALMFAGTPAAGDGVPRAVFGLYVVIASVVTVAVVGRFSEDRPRASRVAEVEAPPAVEGRALANERVARGVIAAAGVGAREPG